MPVRKYDAWCPGCAAEWLGLPADDAALPAGEAIGLTTCGECLSLTSTAVKQSRVELKRIHRDLMKTIQKLCQSHVRVQSRLEDRRKLLARDIHYGNTDQVDTLRDIEARIAGLKPPDVDQLEKRAGAIGAVLNDAPVEAPVVECKECGTPMEVHRETHNGFTVPCPRCSHRLMIRLKVDE